MTNKEKLLSFAAFCQINPDLLIAIIVSAAEKSKSKKEWYKDIKEMNPDMAFEDEEIFLAVIDFIYILLENEELRFYN